jgi:hypothetical protein
MTILTSLTLSRSKPNYQLDFLNSPLTQQDFPQQALTLLQHHDPSPSIYLHASVQSATKRRRQNKFSPRSSPHRSSTAPPQLQTADLPPPGPQRRISSPAISPKTVPISLLMLKACHICHRKPFTRTHLDGYTNCDLCVERTCYICVRECGSSKCSGRVNEQLGDGTQGSGGRKVCSRCAIESGVDGEIVRCKECWENENQLQMEEHERNKWLQELTSAHMDGILRRQHS